MFCTRKVQKEQRHPQRTLNVLHMKIKCSACLSIYSTKIIFLYLSLEMYFLSSPSEELHTLGLRLQPLTVLPPILTLLGLVAVRQICRNFMDSSPKQNSLISKSWNLQPSPSGLPLVTDLDNCWICIEVAGTLLQKCI